MLSDWPTACSVSLFSVHSVLRVEPSIKSLIFLHALKFEVICMRLIACVLTICVRPPQKGATNKCELIMCKIRMKKKKTNHRKDYLIVNPSSLSYLLSRPSRQPVRQKTQSINHLLSLSPFIPLFVRDQFCLHLDEIKSENHQ